MGFSHQSVWYFEYLWPLLFLSPSFTITPYPNRLGVPAMAMGESDSPVHLVPPPLSHA